MTHPADRVVQATPEAWLHEMLRFPEAPSPARGRGPSTPSGPRVVLTSTIGKERLSCHARCGGHTPYNPFLVPRTQLYAGTKTIALAPVCVCTPDKITNSEPVIARYTSYLEKELRAGGFQIVPAQESEAIWKRISDSVGGFFNAVTGARDSAKVEAARTGALRELHDKFGADGWLHPKIVVVGADFKGGTAKWDGAKESYQSFGGKLLAALVGVTTYGTSSALSFLVALEDMHGRDEYADRGGIQLLYKPGRGNQFHEVPRAELFVDPARDSAAVHIALAALLDRAEPEH